MLSFLIGFAGIIITIFFVVGTHEAAHFITARCLGVKVLQFSIGFGKTLWSWRDKSGTQYILALIPLGGYVMMLNEEEHDVKPEDLHRAYNRQAFYKKFLIVLAGPATNILCAILLYWLIFMLGFVTPKPIIGTIEAHSIAAQAGMQGNQEITKIDNTPTPSWTGVVLRILMHAGDNDQLLIETKNITTQKIQNYQLLLTNWRMDDLTPDPLSSLGITPYQPSLPMIIGNINEPSPAATAGLKKGDKIIAVNQIKMDNWEMLVAFISSHPQDKIMMTLLRENKKITLPVMIGYHRDIFLQRTGYLGISPAVTIPKTYLQTIQYPPGDALLHAGKEVNNFIYFNVIVIGKLLTGKLSLQTLGGPITIFESAGEALNYGFIAFCSFLAFLSLSIGLINLLPIPGLDGGHLFIQFIEWIIRRPIPEKWLLLLYRLGVVLIVFVLIQSLINDLVRI